MVNSLRGDIITDSDGDDSGLWCVPMKSQLCQLHSHAKNVMGLDISVVCYLSIG